MTEQRIGLAASANAICWGAVFEVAVALLGVCAALACPVEAFAQSPAASQTDVDSDADDDAAERPVLRIGVKESIPFSMQKDDGSWTGISIELWRDVATDLDLQYEFVDLPLDEIFDRLEKKELDAALAALTVTHDREKRVDFSHSYFHTGLGIAVLPGQGRGWSAVVRRVFSTIFLEIVAGILTVLAVTGVLVYLFERRKNPDNFGNGPVSGIANGIWWAAVTMTTVGYGDQVPKTLGGRLMAIIWMFSAILIISSFTASVTSTLTLARLESDVRGPQDLHRVRVGTVADSTSADYLMREGIAFRKRDTPAACLEDLRAGKIDAVVYDAAMLRYLCLTSFPGELDVLPATFEKQDYAIALPEGSPLREPLNRVLLERLIDSGWQETLRRYFGVPST